MSQVALDELTAAAAWVNPRRMACFLSLPPIPEDAARRVATAVATSLGSSPDLVRVHASGHALNEEQREMLELCRPLYFVPIHGEYRHLMKHKQLAVSLGMSDANCLLVENGAVMCFGRDTVCTKDRVEAGRVFVDGKGVGDVGGLVLRDRRHLSEDGLVIATLVVNKGTYEILSGPDIFSRGFIHEEAKPEIFYEAKCMIFERVDRQLEEDHQLDCGLLQEEIRRELKRFFIRTLDRRPVIYPIVVEI